MIVCPYCGVYWDYLKSLPEFQDSVNNYNGLFNRYVIKEQSDCISHVIQAHSMKVALEMMVNEIGKLRKEINKLEV